MTTSIVRVESTEGVALHGMYVSPDDRAQTVVLHLPGIFGNFYENPFILRMSEYYPSFGVAFLSVNTRDHDAGSSHLRMEDCLPDIDAWLEFCRDLKYANVILQGHSLGTQKAVRYLEHYRMRDGYPRLSALVLLSPFDNVAFYSAGDAALAKSNLERVRDLSTTNPEALVPNDVWSMWPLSNRTYLQLNASDGFADVFPFRRGSLVGTGLSKVSVPVFAAVGSEDFAALPSPVSLVAQLRNMSLSRVVMIDGAPHNFAGRETQLLESLGPWVRGQAHG